MERATGSNGVNKQFSSQNISASTRLAIQMVARWRMLLVQKAGHVVAPTVSYTVHVCYAQKVSIKAT